MATHLIFDPEVIPDDIDDILLEGIDLEGELLRRAKVVERSANKILRHISIKKLLCFNEQKCIIVIVKVT